MKLDENNLRDIIREEVKEKNVRITVSEFITFMNSKEKEYLTSKLNGEALETWIRIEIFDM